MTVGSWMENNRDSRGDEDHPATKRQRVVPRRRDSEYDSERSPLLVSRPPRPLKFTPQKSKVYTAEGITLLCLINQNQTCRIHSCPVHHTFQRASHLYLQFPDPVAIHNLLEPIVYEISLPVSENFNLFLSPQFQEALSVNPTPTDQDRTTEYPNTKSPKRMQNLVLNSLNNVQKQ
jgi:hypothetical protein